MSEPSTELDPGGTSLRNVSRCGSFVNAVVNATRELAALITGDPEDAREAVLRVAARAVGASYGCLYRAISPPALEAEIGPARPSLASAELEAIMAAARSGLATDSGPVWPGTLPGILPGSMPGSDGAAGLLASLSVTDRLLAVLAVGDPDQHGFDAADRAVLEAIAPVAALVLDVADRRTRDHVAGERAAELEQAKSHFLNRASHELRTPLAVLVGYLSLAEEGAFGELPPRFQQLIPLLDAKLTEMNALIADMIETARLDDGSMHLDLTSIDLRAVVAAAAEGARSGLASNQSLEVETTDTAVPVTGDFHRLQRIVSNLMDNAVKYSPGHTPVRCVVRAESDLATVEVQDRGVGIASGDVGVLFTRFGRVDDAVTRQMPGAGLGLFLARELARVHGGDVRLLDSTPGEGSRFALTLPLRHNS